MWLTPDACELATEPRPGLFTQLLLDARERPALALACQGILKREEQRDRVIREAFLTATSRDRLLAAKHLSQVLDRPWLGQVNFFDALAVAEKAGPDGAKLLIAATRNNPSLALREWRRFEGQFPYAQSILEEAVLLVPDEAVALAAGGSVSGVAIGQGMRASTRPEVKALVAVIDRPGIDPVTKQRLGVLVGAGQPIAAAAKIASDEPAWLARVVDLRIAATGDRALVLDRVVGNASQMLFREVRGNKSALERLDLKRMPPRVLFLLLAYGRTETDDDTFGVIFDKALVPKLGKGGLAVILRETKGLQLRKFLTASLQHQRFDEMLAIGGESLLRQAMRGVNSLDETIAAAEVLDAVPKGKLLDAALNEVSTNQDPLYGLLTARVAYRLPSNHPARKQARAFLPYLQAPDTMKTIALFNRERLCVQRHFFYHDDDGVESFLSFKSAYASDPQWKIHERGGYLHISGSGAAGKRIEIYANIPIDITKPGNANREAEALTRNDQITRLLSEKKIEPDVLVHRGHAFHVDKTLRYLNRSLQFVFLGSCRGMEAVDQVMSVAPATQIVATRNVGAMAINDPLLKALNDEFLSSRATLDWEKFWAIQRQKLGSNEMFRDYVPPHRNSAAILLAAWYRYLAAD